MAFNEFIRMKVIIECTGCDLSAKFVRLHTVCVEVPRMLLDLTLGEIA
jgi:hypothetical protein